MKKKSEKKLKLGKIKIATLSLSNQSEGDAFRSAACSFKCTNDFSQGAPICSVDSCRF
jgi:hypothetical protein